LYDWHETDKNRSIGMSPTNHIRMQFARCLGLLVPALLAMAPAVAAAVTESKGVVAVVNDQPITSFDVNQRIKLTSVLGSGKKLTRKEALELLINDILKRNETARVKAALSEEQVDAAVERLAKGTGTTVEGLNAKLKSAGISMKALRLQLQTNLSFNRVLISKYKIKPAIEDADVDKKLAALKQDPRLKPVSVYEIREIVLPVELNDAFASQLMQTRAIEAQQIQQNFKSCAKVNEAVSGIFNVKVSKLIQAPAEQLPKKMRDILEQAGTSTLIGPMRAKEGIQLIAFCGKRTITPEGPSREQVQRMLIEQVYDVYEEKYLRDLRRTALIDYKDPSLKQDQTQ
jgi:peptidyl-prolyl cis-trans isomerase SurA